MDAELGFSLRLSLQTSLIAVVGLTVFTVPLAWLMSRARFRGKRVVEAILLLPMIMPPTVLGYYLVMLLGRNGLIGKPVYDISGWSIMFSWWGGVVAAAAVGFPLLFQCTYISMRLIDPDLESTAYTMGASKLQAFWYVTIPLARKGLLSGIALAFARAMGEFGATLMLAGSIPGRTVTMPLAIYNSFAAGRMSEANIMAIAYTCLSIIILGCISTGPVLSAKESFAK